MRQTKQSPIKRDTSTPQEIAHLPRPQVLGHSHKPLVRNDTLTKKGTPMTPNPNKPRLLTGDRPTGRLHLGHFVGSLANRVKLQRDYEAFFIIADLHTLTTRPERESIREIPAYIGEMVLDYLAVGIDPEVSTIFVQSAIPET